MTTRIYVEAKGLLSTSGVILEAELNGTVIGALTELRSARCDFSHVEDLLRPILMIALPGSTVRVVVRVKYCGGNILYIEFNCSDTYRKFLMGFCEAMDIHYILAEIT